METVNTTSVVYKALMDIKYLISQDPNREIVGQSALTLRKIYDVIEETQRQIYLKHE